jgi:hypothetical protein
LTVCLFVQADDDQVGAAATLHVAVQAADCTEAKKKAAKDRKQGKVDQATYAAAGEVTDSKGNEVEVTVQFEPAYEAMFRRTGELRGCYFAFGDNPGKGEAPGHMRQQTTKLSEMYIYFGGGRLPIFVAEDCSVSVTNGVRLPTFISVCNRRPAPGTRVYVHFAVDHGRRYTWGAGFYLAVVL